MVFVHLSRQEMAAVRSTLNVYDFLRDRSTGAPTCIPDAQMADFRYTLDYSQDQVILTGESIPKGTRVVVAKGDLQGLRGELVRYNNKYHILVRIDMFGSAMVTIPLATSGKRNKKYICKENTIICNGDNNICNG